MNKQLLEKIEMIRDKTLQDVTSLCKMFDWDQKIDLRIHSISKLIYIQMGLHTVFCYASLELENEEMMKRMKSQLISNINDVSRDQLFGPFGQLIKQGFVASLFFSIESTLRVYCLRLDPDYHITSQGNPKKRQFHEIYKHLLDNILNFKDTELINLKPTIQMISNLKNTLHNNGIHYGLIPPAPSESVEITYRQNEYKFIPSERVDFVSWDLLLDLCDDTRSIFFHLSKHHKIAYIDGIIIDPSVDSKLL